MISALLIRRKGSVGFPGKNTYPISGKLLSLYPMLAAQKAQRVIRCLYQQTVINIRILANDNGVEVIERPAYFVTKEAKGEDVFMHGYQEIEKRSGVQELIVLLHCNSATVSAEPIDQGIDILTRNL
ncbi:MAG: hypothetical protein HQL15_00975 [Candidatus Omnitrophica bacterium]|nr:hypothetical protein [Candidatus Omnitrophota bacterium]